MTGDTIDGSTDEEFEYTLQRRLRGAHENGIDVEGACLCRNDGDGHPDWETHVVELEKPTD